MSSSSGLTRRRGGGGGAAAEGESSNGGIQRNNSSSNFDNTPETSYESNENGHKIAFDPRDISESTERSKQPKLTLMEEVLLLGLKDKQVRSVPSFDGNNGAQRLDPRDCNRAASMSAFVSASIALLMSWAGRDTSLFGTITYLMPFEAASSWSLPFAAGSACRRTPREGASPCQTVSLRLLMIH